MKITELAPEQYGIYRQASWFPSTTELNVVMGENESGKTTMLRFIRDMLFGYGRGKWKNNFGSMAFVRDDGSTYRVLRKEKDSEFINSQGERYKEELPLLWWNGLNRAMYEQIFAVGLEDLQGTSFLANDSVRSRFFMLQGGEKIANGKADIVEEREELFLASPLSKRKINILLGELEDIRKELDILARQEKDFSDLQKQQKLLLEDIQKRQGALEEKHKEDKSLEKRLGAWEYYKRAREIKRQMALSEEVSVFPSNGKEQWNKLINRMKVVREQMDSVDQRLSEYTPQKKEDIIPWASLESELERLYVELGQWRQTMKDADELRLQITDWQNHHKNLGWMLSLWGKPLDWKEMCPVIDWVKGRELADAVIFKQNELHFRQGREPKVETLEPSVLPEEGITNEEEWKSYEEVAQGLERAIHRETELVHKKNLLGEKNSHAFTLWLWGGFLSALVAGAGVVGFYMSLAGMTVLYISFAVATVSILFFLLHVWSRKKTHKALKKTEIELAETIDLKEMLGMTFGEKAPRQEDDVPAFHNFMQEQRNEFFHRQTIRQAEAWKAETVKKQQAEHDEWEQERDEILREIDEGMKAWNAWTKENHLPSAKPENMATLQEEWQKIYSSEGMGKILALRNEKLQSRLSHFENEAASIIAAADLPYETTPEAIARIYEENKKRMFLWQSVLEKNEQYAGYVREKEKLEGEWASCEREMQVLFDLVHAKDAEDFQEKVNAHEHRDQIRQEWEHVKQDLRLYAGSEEAFQTLWDILETGKYEEWMSQHETLLAEIATAEKELGEKQKEAGAVENEIFRLAHDDTITKALQRKKEKEEELSLALESWLTCVYTEYLMEQTQKRYEAGKQPKILERANRFFSAMTGGKYSLLLDEKTKDVTILDRHKDRKTSDIWSSGTGDQVYLSVRLAMALSFGEQVESLPIVLDDIFVRFDEERQRETLRFLMDLGKEQQLFLFTCHAQTMRIAEEVGQEKQAGAFTRIHAGQIQCI